MSTFFIPEREKCNTLALDFFLKMSGLDKEGTKFERMRDEANQMRKVVEDRIKPQCVYEYFDDLIIHDNKLQVAGKTFICPAFSQINTESIKGIYIYAVSVGDFGYSDEPIMKQIYADIWGNAFTDAVRLMMKEHFEEEHMLSDSFGPGFYGMDTLQMRTIGELLDFESIGIELRNGRILIPLKACAGIIFSVDKNYKKLRKECLECKGNHYSCRFCQLEDLNNDKM